MADLLNKLMDKLGYQFSNSQLLHNALSHRSIGLSHNERLEFLGDAVLGFVMADELYRRYPHADEGELSRLRALVVNGDVLAKVAMDLALSDHLRLSAGEVKTGGRQRPSILAGALEAIIGAIYIDGGLEPCRLCVLQWYGSRIDNLSHLETQKDAKSRLQEWLQAHQLPLPDYVATVTGEPHAQIFTIHCSVMGLAHVTIGEGTTRRRAEQMAAEKFLALLHE